MVRVSTSKDGVRVAAISGAAGGIGTALARRFAADGYALALTDRDAAGLDALAEELAAGPMSVTSFAVDLRAPGALDDWAAHIADAHGRLDVLINNAGMTTWGQYEHLSAEDIDRVMDVNVRGVMHACRACLPLLRRDGGGQIVNIASMVALFPTPFQTSYAASKAAIRSFSHTLRIELRPVRIGVTAVLPGSINTHLIERAPTHAPEQSQMLAGLLARHAISPTRVATRVAAAVRRNRGEIRVGVDAHAIAFMARFCPRLLAWTLTRLYPRFARDDGSDRRSDE